MKVSLPIDVSTDYQTAVVRIPRLVFMCARVIFKFEKSGVWNFLVFVLDFQKLIKYSGKL